MLDLLFITISFYNYTNIFDISDVVLIPSQLLTSFESIQQ